MIEVLIITMAIALTAAFALLLLKKWGVVEYLQVHGSELISQMAGCDFCLSWWTCLIVSVIAAVIFENPFHIFAAVLATPITRKLQ